MKKTMLFILCVTALVTSACADNYHPITCDQLPVKAQTFLSTYFPNSKISLVRREIDVTDLGYDVIFTDGCKVEFNHKGEWTEVDCITHPLPEGVVPAAIESVINAHYPDAKAVKIEVDRREYDVKLNNRVELTFNKKMQLIDID